jgi:hypothetical protein
MLRLLLLVMLLLSTSALGCMQEKNSRRCPWRRLLNCLSCWSDLPDITVATDISGMYIQEVEWVLKVICCTAAAEQQEQ